MTARPDAKLPPRKTAKSRGARSANGGAAPSPIEDLPRLAQQMRERLVVAIGHEIHVGRLLTDSRYARDVLLVCDACTGTDLPLLSQRFRELLALAQVRPGLAVKERERLLAAAQPPGHSPQATEWARNTSGFGEVTHPLPLPPRPTEAPRPERRRNWLLRWPR